jgi:ABC-type transporter Mla subunit MlaD
MASMKEASSAITDRLENLVGELRSELDGGDIDFQRLAGVADQISEAADGLADTFNSVNETLMQRLDQLNGGSSSSSSSTGSSQKKTSKAS